MNAQVEKGKLDLDELREEVVAFSGMRLAGEEQGNVEEVNADIQETLAVWIWLYIDVPCNMLS